MDKTYSIIVPIAGFQVVIPCGGDGSRFARSIGKKPPYAKQLEIIGDKTILQRSAESFIRMMPLDGITFALRPEFLERAKPIMHIIQAEYPNIPVSYTVRQKKYPSIVEETYHEMKTNVYDLDGNRISLDPDIVAFCYGDSVTDGKGDTERLKQMVINEIPYIKSSRGLVINGGPTLKDGWHKLSFITTFKR